MIRKLLITATLPLFLASCGAPEPVDDWSPEPYVRIENAEWARNATLYQLNTRQFTPEGTFNTAEKQLPRLKEMGVDIIWLMPIHPIGEKNRKGTLGSPYSVRDYYAVNPEFGTLDDFKHFVSEAHRLGMKVIIDLVANHTAWDNKIAEEHPDWFEKDWKGDFRPTPWLDWSDIIDLDWSKTGVRAHVGGAMEYWVREADIDGYRADVAGYVPIDFWNEARRRLEKIKPVFMLAEWKTPEMHRAAFDASYAWDWHNIVKQIAHGQADATALYGYYAENESSWPREAMRMTYIANHDSNSWEGTQYENFGDALPVMIAFSFAGEGLPLIYNGQEACNAKRLEFFKKDSINWDAKPDCDLNDLFTRLIRFKKANAAMGNGKWGGRMVGMDNDNPSRIFSFTREKDGNQIVMIANFSPKPSKFRLTTDLATGEYDSLNGEDIIRLQKDEEMQLGAWEYLLLSRNRK